MLFYYIPRSFCICNITHCIIFCIGYVNLLKYIFAEILKMRRRDVTSAAATDQEREKTEASNRRQLLVESLEKKLNRVLGPLEPLLMYVQSVLAWERPRHSVVMLIGINFLFWLATSTNYRFFFLLAIAAMIIIFIDTWRNQIWPEIKLPSPSDDDNEDWIPVHLKLLSGPEINHHAAEILTSIYLMFRTLWEMRRDRPFLFCLLVSTACIVVAVVGHFLPGVMVLYVLVMSLLLWPAVEYHQLMQQLYTKLEPFLMRLDYRMKMKNWRSKKDRSENSGVGDHAETESDDEFSPSDDPETTAALARAVTDSEEECHSENLTPGLLTPGIPSLPDLDADTNSDHEAEFLEGLGDFPSIHDHDPESLFSDDLDLATQPSSLRSSQPESEFGSNLLDNESVDEQHNKTLTDETKHDGMEFVPSHFRKHDDDSNDEDFSSGMKFDEASDVALASSAEDNRRAEVLGSAVSSAVASTMSGLQRLGGTVLTAALQAAQERSERMSGGANIADHSSPMQRSTDSEGSDSNDFEILDPKEFEK